MESEGMRLERKPHRVRLCLTPDEWAEKCAEMRERRRAKERARQRLVRRKSSAAARRTRSERARAWRLANPGKCKRYHDQLRDRRRGNPKHHGMQRSYRAELRLRAIAKMGGACEACGEADPDVMEFDHKTPVLRRTNHLTREGSDRVHRKIMAMDDPRETYSLLCANCHRRKTRANREFHGWTISPAGLFVPPSQLKLFRNGDSDGNQN